METTQPHVRSLMHKRLEWHFRHIRATNEERRSKERSKSQMPQALFSDICELKARFADFPPLPPRLPRPEYAIDYGLLHSGDPAELDFYCACRMGYQEAVEAYVREVKPTHAVRQFGLQMASFGNQPAIARYLLLIGTTLHGYVFAGTEPGSRRRQTPKGASIFHVYPKGDILIPLMQTFIEFGWHPNKAWEPTQDNWPVWPFYYLCCVWNTPLVRFFLSYGADPNIGSCWPDLQAMHGLHERLDFTVEIPLHRQSTSTLELAIEGCDPTSFEMLRASSSFSINIAELSPLFVLALPAEEDLRENENTETVSYSLLPFVGRRAIAEHMLNFDDVDINRIKLMERGEQETALTYACSMRDWGYVEWLLERGADPTLLEGKAFSYDHKKLMELMEKLAAANPSQAIQFTTQYAKSNLRLQLDKYKTKFGITD
ncbi:ankyrin repeat protein [Colletotrichum tofieldiae]|uniref:Ankyrin repeat protein n=1 Tax=Colletotrichum tofieldiae TaxID=708197 RepID=A0A166SFR7_9PEZI|nr:ankyrin repeat protein [Colletotrichum tofieldiae]